MAVAVKMKNTFGIQILLGFVFCIVYLQNTAVQAQQGDCSVNIKDHYNVSETAPSGMQILSIPASASVTWTMGVSYAQLPASVNGKLDSYLKFSRANSNTYLLTVNKTLDLEEINKTLGFELNTLTLTLTCRQTGQDLNREVVVRIDPVNEFYPEFIGEPFAFNISEKEAVGFVILSLDSMSRDHDVRPGTGEISDYSLDPFDFTRFHAKPEVDGRGNFTMADQKQGSISVATNLDFEQLLYYNLTTMWLNVTVTDYAGNTNWTTIQITVTDDDDLSPEFYASGSCVPQPFKAPPCFFIYKAKFPVNATGYVTQIKPAQILAQDRDTINNSVIYSLANMSGSPGIASHMTFDDDGKLRVISPFLDSGVFPVTVVATEVSKNHYTAQTTLELNVSVFTPDPSTTTTTFDSTSQSGSGGAVTTGPGSNGNGGGGGGGGGGQEGGGGDGSTGGGGYPSSGASTSSDDSSDRVVIIGIVILGLIVVALAVALIVTCLKVRHKHRVRVGSADSPSSSTKSFVKKEELPDQSGTSSQLEKKRQGDILNSLPEANERGNRLPPLQPSASGAAPNPDIFDGTRSFDGNLGHDFFTARGKTKVPRLLSDNNADMKPIFIDE